MQELQEKEDKCKICFNCLSCKVYFWRELGEYFFDKTNIEKKKQKYLPIKQIPEEILRHVDMPSVGIDEMYLYKVRRTARKRIKNKLIMLKGMSSSTPSMLNNIFDTEEFVGGGFYFNWQGHGVVIDPGYCFVRNLHHYGLSVLDIDTVIITHEHIDHNIDMRVLEDINFSLSRYNKETEKVHIICWYMDKVSYDIALTLQKNNAGFHKKTNDLYCIESEKKCEPVELQKNNLIVQFFNTQHIYIEETEEYSKHTVGCKFSCLNDSSKHTIVYTFDTKFFPELTKYVKDAEILIANISSIYEDDYMLIKGKKNHLGYLGCYYLIKACYEQDNKLKFCFISEFWNGNSDIRYDVTKCLKQDLRIIKNNDINIIPSEVGMIIDIEQCKIKCTQCGRFSKNIVVKKATNLKNKIEVICDKCFY